MQRSSVGYSLAHWKNICPRRPKFGPGGRHFVSGNSFFCLGGAAKLRWAEGRAAPRWAWQGAQNDGCAQRTGAHARPKPTSKEGLYKTIDKVYQRGRFPFHVVLFTENHPDS